MSAWCQEVPRPYSCRDIVRSVVHGVGSGIITSPGPRPPRELIVSAAAAAVFRPPLRAPPGGRSSSGEDDEQASKAMMLWVWAAGV